MRYVSAEVTSQARVSGTITRVAGIPSVPPPFPAQPPPDVQNTGDDGPATEAQLSQPQALAVTLDGGFLVGSPPVVRKVSAAGVISTVAGNGTFGTSGDDGPAIEAQLGRIDSLAITRDGGFLVADSDAGVVREVSVAGVIRRVAGSGVFGSGGDDGLALEAPFRSPEAVAVMTDGGFLIADSGNNVVRRVSPDGIITRAAGTGTPGHSGDDGLAVEAQLKLPSGLAIFQDGSFLIADSGNSVVRRVSPDGVITRVAGTGSQGSPGDDGPATEAQLFEPQALSLSADGGFLILQGNSIVRKVAPAGTISRVAGTGTPAGSGVDLGDDGPATEARFVELFDLVTTHDGGLLLSDIGAHVVRKVWP